MKCSKYSTSNITILITGKTVPKWLENEWNEIQWNSTLRNHGVSPFSQSSYDHSKPFFELYTQQQPFFICSFSFFDSFAKWVQVVSFHAFSTRFPRKIIFFFLLHFKCRSGFSYFVFHFVFFFLSVVPLFYISRKEIINPGWGYILIVELIQL